MDALDSSCGQKQRSEFGAMGLRLPRYGDDVRGKADFLAGATSIELLSCGSVSNKGIWNEKSRLDR